MAGKKSGSFRSRSAGPIMRTWVWVDSSLWMSRTFGRVLRGSAATGALGPFPAQDPKRLSASERTASASTSPTTTRKEDEGEKVEAWNSTRSSRASVETVEVQHGTGAA